MVSPLNRFNGVAWVYDMLTTIVFGKHLHQAQVYHLREIPKNANVLIIGGGTGRILPELLSIIPTCRIWYVEASSAMIKRSKQNVIKFENPHINFIHGTENSLPDGIIFDAVIAHFFLDLFPEQLLEAVISKINSSVRPNGIWLVCDFINDGKRWKQMLLQIMYGFFRLICRIEAHSLPCWERALERSGMRLMDSRLFFRAFIKGTFYLRAINPE